MMKLMSVVALACLLGTGCSNVKQEEAFERKAECGRAAEARKQTLKQEDIDREKRDPLNLNPTMDSALRKYCYSSAKNTCLGFIESKFHDASRMYTSYFVEDILGGGVLASADYPKDILVSTPSQKGLVVYMDLPEDERQKYFKEDSAQFQAYLSKMDTINESFICDK